MDAPTDQMHRDAMTDILREPFPVELLDDKNGMTYIAAEYVRKRVIEATGNCFDWVTDPPIFRQDKALREVELKHNGKPTGELHEPVICICTGRLTIPGLGTRAGWGVQEIQVGGGADSAYKGAESDAFKRAAMAFGVGLQQLYIETGEAKRARKGGRPVPPPSGQLSTIPRTPNPRASDDPYPAEERRIDETEAQARGLQPTKREMPAYRPPANPKIEETKEKEAMLRAIFAIASKLNVEDATLKETMRTKYRPDTPIEAFSRKDLALDELIHFRDVMQGRLNREQK